MRCERRQKKGLDFSKTEISKEMHQKKMPNERSFYMKISKGTRKVVSVVCLFFMEISKGTRKGGLSEGCFYMKISKGPEK